MARSILASALLSRLDKMCDTESDTHISTAEKYEILSSAVADTWDHIVAAGIGSEYVKPVTFSTVVDQSEYAIATIAPLGDFYKVSELYVDEGSGQFRPIPRIPPAERQVWRAPNKVVTMKLYYLPAAPVWTAGTESFDGINGWEEHTLQTAAITIKNKKGDDAGPYRARKRELEARIASMANKNGAEPPRVIQRRKARIHAMFTPFNNNVSGWDIRGANLELMYRYGVGFGV